MADLNYFLPKRRLGRAYVNCWRSFVSNQVAARKCGKEMRQGIAARYRGKVWRQGMAARYGGETARPALVGWPFAAEPGSQKP